MALNDSIRYQDGYLWIDRVRAEDLLTQYGSPLYVYSLKRALSNLQRLQAAFAPLGAVEVHYSAKANANLHILRALVQAGAGIDAVSAGEIYRALQAGALPEQIVYAGVGKRADEIAYALEQGIGWFNVENEGELQHIERLAGQMGKQARVALRFNPEVTANTHPYIATGHGGAKFGMTAETIQRLLAQRQTLKATQIAALHVHIGSQLRDTQATLTAVERALEMIASYEDIRTLNIGGGFPAPYQMGEALPEFSDFAQALAPLVRGYQVLLEPGRSIIADAGVLLTRVLYPKYQGGQHLLIVDASMTELIRPALYQAKHSLVALVQTDAPSRLTQVVGPVCETADVLGRDVELPALTEGEGLAILTAGAYGMVMASHYNARPKPAEVVILPDGVTVQLARRRETWADLVQAEL